MFFSINEQISIIVFGFDLLGTFAFAISGALLGKRREYNYWGTLTLAFCTALGGGTLRNVLVNLIPPVLQTNGWLYIICVVAAASLIHYGWYFFKFKTDKLRIKANRVLARADAIGLATFVMLGAKVAMMCELPFLGIVSFSVLTGTGGGIIRDVIAGEKPYAFRNTHYITWCVIGGALAAGLHYERPLVVSYCGLVMYKALFALVPVIFILICRFIEINKEFPLIQNSDNNTLKSD